MFSSYQQYFKNIIRRNGTVNCGQKAVPKKDDWSEYFHCCCTAYGCPICFWGPPKLSCQASCCKCNESPPPCLAVCDTSAQIICTKKPQLITFNTNLIARTIRHNLFSGRISFPVPGIYFITVTASVGQTENALNHWNIWVRQNGVDVDFSNRRIDIPSAGRIQTVTAAYVLQLFTDDSLEFYQTVDNPDAGAGLYPEYPDGAPSMPSAMVAVNLISF